MKLIIWIAVIAGIFFGGKWLYENGYINTAKQKFENSSLSESLNNTVQRTKDFATDKAVREADFNL